MADLLVAETTCDGKKKMFELMGESRDLYVLELPQMADSPEGLDWWTAQLRKLRDELTRRFGVEITDAKLREAIRAMNRERRLRRDLAAIMKKDRPPLTGRDVLDCKSTISGIPADLDQYARVIETLGEAEGDRNVADRVRVLMTGVPVVHGAERALDLIEDCGGLVVCQESCTGLRPILDDVDADAPDPLRALAEKYYRLPCSVMTPNLARLESRAQCVIELIWQACLTYDVESHYVRRLAEESLHVPYLRIETDYSPSDSARIAVRIEALFEMVRGGPAGVEGRATG